MRKVYSKMWTTIIRFSYLITREVWSRLKLLSSTLRSGEIGKNSIWLVIWEDSRIRCSLKRFRLWLTILMDRRMGGQSGHTSRWCLAKKSDKVINSFIFTGPADRQLIAILTCQDDLACWLSTIATLDRSILQVSCQLFSLTRDLIEISRFFLMQVFMWEDL